MSEATAGTMLMRLGQARAILAELRTVNEVKDLRDTAQAVQHYLKQRDGSFDAQQDAAEIKLRAERRLGELLAETVNHNGSRGVGSTMLPTIPAGIDKHQSHRFQKVASLPDAEFEKHIAETRAAEEELTTAGVMRAAKQETRAAVNADILNGADACTVDDLHKLVRAGQKFGTIYVDPPWQYGNQATRASTDNHYPTMTLDEIAALPVKELGAENSHLHLWTTNAFGFESATLLDAWGYANRGLFVWCKPQMGLGNYWRVSQEYLQLGLRGSCPFHDHSLKGWAVIDRGGHSSKPIEVRRLIERASPGPRLELFAREPADGWTVWGNQISRRTHASVSAVA